MIDGYLYDLDVPEGGDESEDAFRLDFQFAPKEIKHSVASGWKGQPVPGHSHQRLQHGGSGPRTHNLSLDFYGDSDDVAFVRNQVAWIESLTYSEYDENGQETKAPHTVLLVYGSFLAVRCKLTTFSVTFSFFVGEDGFPRIAKVDLVFEEIVDTAVDYRQVRP